MEAGEALDHQPGSRVRTKKSARDRLIRLALTHPEWALGFQDEVWWSRLAAPGLHAWAEDEQPLHLVEQAVAKDDPDPKALACYGLLVRWATAGQQWRQQVWLRFVDGRPVSSITTQFLAWCCTQLQAARKTALLLVWDNNAWHVSAEVRAWIGAHNQQVKQTGAGVRIVNCYLPVQSPWLNPIEPMWLHAKRRVVEPARLLPAADLIDRVCAALDCPHERHLTIPQEVA